jgi:cyclophilin family peptidyl-prolyl cis-trans isomerase
MSDDRRRQQRAEQVRRRRQQRPITTTSGRANEIEMPGVFGWMHRNGRLFVLVGIIVMVASLGGTFLLQSANKTNPNQSTATATPTIEPGKPVGTPGPDGVIRRYAAAPPLVIDPKKSYTAVIHTEKGDITAQLLPDKAPIDTNNFVFLARNRFFDGLTFHRVVSGFVVQGGDPLGNGTGGPGYTLPVEKNDVQFDTGILAMAASSAGVSGSQFFITLAPQPQLEPQFSAFGRVTSGMEVVTALTVRDPQGTAQPPPDRILKIDIIEK